MIYVYLFGTVPSHRFFNLASEKIQTDVRAVIDRFGPGDVEFQIIDSSGPISIEVAGTVGTANSKLIEIGNQMTGIGNVLVHLDFGARVRCEKGSQFDIDILNVAKGIVSAGICGTEGWEEIKEKENLK